MTDKTFIETQFPVSKVSKESYKERMANYSQTLTGLGKWWGRKPLVLVRATIVGLLMPASDNPEKDREIFLKIMTMDEEGLWLRYLAKEGKLPAKTIYEILTDEEHHVRVLKALQKVDHGLTLPMFEADRKDQAKVWQDYFNVDGERVSWAKFSKETGDHVKGALERIAFSALYYDEKLNYCVRPEQIAGPSAAAFKEINAHLGTKARNLQELIHELGQRRFGHNPKVGDAFCGGGSIPFEAARLGCDVYASDLNPVAALLTWAAIHIVGGGPEVAEQVKKAQQEVYDAVDQQICEWGIEHNVKGHRADAYLYCVEVKDPETGWMVPLAPSWIIGEKTKTVAILVPDEKKKRYDIQIKMDASAAEMKAAKEGTVKSNYVVHPKNPNPIPMSIIRRENQGGLRLWENEDVVPRPDDVFQERLYCIRWVVPPAHERVRTLVKLARLQRDNEEHKLILDEISEAQVKNLKKATGIDFSGYSYSVDNYAIRKVIKDHGDSDHEEKRGQIAVTDEAFELIPYVLENYDKVSVSPEKNKRGLEVLIFEKRINGAIFYLTETRTGKKELSLNTMYIRRGRDNALADPAPSSGTLPLEDDNDHFRELCQELIKKSVSKEYRYYTAPDHADLQREAKVLSLLQARFSDWQKVGHIPSRKIEPGEKTDEPIRNRGWSHWHHLYNPRQLLANGAFLQESDGCQRLPYIYFLLVIATSGNRNSRLVSWVPSYGVETTDQVFTNQALNTKYNFGCRGLLGYLSILGNVINEQNTQFNQIKNHSEVATTDSIELRTTNDLWLTDPPYADAVNYHELSEFFLTWYERKLTKVFPDWVVDSRRDLAIKGNSEDFRRSMVKAYTNLAKHMSANGLQVVMFTHQDAGVWADLAVILWASGLQVTSAWTIATETTSALKEGNYVQGTVLLILRKNTSTEVAFLDEMVPRIEQEVKAQVESMERIEDKEEPNFSDTDYQLAAYAAALRIITGYRQIEDLNVERELSRSAKDAKSPLESIIENARNVAAAIRIPEAFDILLWKSISPEERYYLRGLDFESKGENKAGAFQELAKNYGIRDYTELLGSVKANETRVKTAAEFASAQMSGDGFAASTLRHLLYAIHVAVTDESPETGRNYLRSELPDFWSRRQNIIKLLEYLARFEHSVRHRSAEFKMAALLAGVLANDAG
ncbi:DUF1156 domain-containing protein [Turneriella parva]|uniref:DUF1156 domain-containing protein n=1 Tax=Turneriella parva (strain ATCC BAA-1111 / DSM 21527 / NCTC 11395 / H) TaxID=869212 RepID=I4BA95_TURPD|nr:DUF1156 domain-containing protein [Turneriella parva]AFM14202.1 protein of unknown function DUF1156 [Turneriella parva DSM 21527]